MTDQARQLKKDGFTIIKSAVDDATIDRINRDIEQILSDGRFRTNSTFYGYNDSPRIVESWKRSRAVAELAYQPAVLDLLREVYGASALPFSTINFLRSSQQPLHSDTVHFGTLPRRRLAAAWFALEDINPLAGPLQVIPESHLLPEFEYDQIGLPPARTLGETQAIYQQYELWIRELVEKLKLKRLSPTLKKGDVLIWSDNLLHGSPDCEKPEMSRKSLVVHYIFDDVALNYVPSHSQPALGRYVRRNVEIIEQPQQT